MGFRIIQEAQLIIGLNESRIVKHELKCMLNNLVSSLPEVSDYLKVYYSQNLIVLLCTTSSSQHYKSYAACNTLLHSNLSTRSHILFIGESFDGL